MAGNTGTAIITEKRFVPENFYHLHVGMKVKFALEQPLAMSYLMLLFFVSKVDSCHSIFDK